MIKSYLRHNDRYLSILRRFVGLICACTMPFGLSSAQTAHSSFADGKTAPVNTSATTSAPLTNMMDIPIASLPSVADLVEGVSPSVLNIIVRTETGETTSEGQGSGFIISPKGDVVTNYHVIAGGSSISVEFANGENYPATVVGTDEETDLAVLKITSERTFSPVQFHQGDTVRIGDWVVAIGNPFGIGQSTSLGIISAIGRERVESGSYVDYIQTDATINRGNSGGPLFNLNGDVVGVNSAIYSPTGASVGIAFVIPHYTAQSIVAQIMRDGRVRRGYLGAGLRSAEFELENRPGVFKAGATINSIVPGGPADQYGLQVDDIILNINGTSVMNAVDATRMIGALKPDETARIIYERREQSYSLNISIGERPSKEIVDRTFAVSQGLPPPPPKDNGRARVNIDTGLNVLDLSSTFRDSIGMRSDQAGIYVESVTPGSKAEQSQFTSGMVLMEIDGEPIAEVSTFKTLILRAKLAEKGSVLVQARRRDGQETYLSLIL